MTPFQSLTWKHAAVLCVIAVIAEFPHSKKNPAPTAADFSPVHSVEIATSVEYCCHSQIAAAIQLIICYNVKTDCSLSAIATK